MPRSLQHNYLNDKIIPVFQEALKTSESVQFIEYVGRPRALGASGSPSHASHCGESAPRNRAPDPCSLTNNKLTRNAQINWDSNGRFELIGCAALCDAARHADRR